MRILSLAAAALAAFATTATSQSPLTTLYTGSGPGTPGANVYFDLLVTEPAGITIERLEINTSVTASGLTLSVYTTPGTSVGVTNFGAYTLQATGLVEPAGGGNASRVCLGAGFYLPPGQHGVTLIGAGIDLRTTVAFGSVSSGYSTNELGLVAGAVSTGFFTSPQITQRVWNGSIYYEVGANVGGVCASSRTFGQGCYDRAPTWYETFASLAAFDLAGAPGTERVLVATPDGMGGYTVSNGASAWFPTITMPLVNNFIWLGPLADDDVSRALPLPFPFEFAGGGSVSVIHATSNGSIILGPTTEVHPLATASINALLSQHARLCPLWCDLHAAANASSNPASGVHFDIAPDYQTVFVTWLDVADGLVGAPVAGATSINVQCALHASGAFEFRYQSISGLSGMRDVVVGWSQGDTSGSDARDPGSVDLSAAVPFAARGPDSIPLTHDVGMPLIGSSLSMSVGGAESISPVAFLFVGDTAYDPGIDLTPVGAPGCLAFTNGLASTFVLLMPGGNGTFLLPIPNSPLLIGSTFSSQCTSLTLKNTLNLLTSNGAEWQIGL